jgi:hypothetical protein
MDEVGFWRRLLTTDERDQLYNSGSGIGYDDLDGGPAEATLDQWFSQPPLVFRSPVLQVGWFITDPQAAWPQVGRRLKGTVCLYARLAGQIHLKFRYGREPLHMNRSGFLYVGSDNVVEWQGLQDDTTGAYITNATVTFSLKDRHGNEITSGSLSYISDWASYPDIYSTDGNYRGNIEEDVKLTPGETYYLEILATASSDRIGKRRIKVQATYQDRV